MECLISQFIILRVSEERGGSSLDLNLLLSAQGATVSWPLCTLVPLPVKCSEGPLPTQLLYLVSSITPDGISQKQGLNLVEVNGLI